MFFKQISVFLENKTGRLAEITGVLADNGIDIKALSIADTNDFGILRLIVDKPAEALTALTASGFRVRETPVVGLSLEHKPGGLHRVLKLMEKNNIFIEYIYDFLSAGTSETATIVAKLENQDEAVAKMRKLEIKFSD